MERNTNRIPTHCRDDWLSYLRDSRPIRKEVGSVSVGELLVFHLFDIRTSYNKVLDVIHLGREYDGHKPANAFSEPVITIAPTESSVSASPRAWLSSTIRAAFKAFRALGRLSVINTTEGSGRKAMILEYEEAVDSALAARGSRRKVGTVLRSREYIVLH